MNITTLTPTSIEGIKRLAKRLSKDSDLPLAEALNQAAVRAGYADYHQAQKHLKDKPYVNVRIAGHYNEDGARKTMVTNIRLGRGLRTFLRPRDIQICLRLYRMEIIADDHIAAFYAKQKASFVKDEMAKTARTLQFMDATGLKPSKAEIYRATRYDRHARLPERDHSLTWRDPETKALIMMDEPYDHVTPNHPSRVAWAAERGYEIERLEWGGTYYPEFGSVCDLISDKERGYPIEKVVAAMKDADPGFRVDKAVWIEHEGVYGTPTAGEIREAKEREARKASQPPRVNIKARIGGTLIYAGGRKRPAGSLPLKHHAEMGRILRNAETVARERQGARRAISSLRSMLEDWANWETDRKLSNDDLFDLYYGKQDRSRDIQAQMSFGKPTPKLKTETLGSLTRMRQILVDGYPDGVGRDSALKLVDKALRSIEGMPTRAQK